MRAPVSWPVAIGGWIRVVHTFPVAIVTTTTVALALASGGTATSPARVALLGATMFCGQCSIGIHNDLVDRERDAIAKPTKPIAAGLVAPSTARVVAILAGLLFVGLAATLGPLALAVALAAQASGYAYNLWLKHTAHAWLGYLAGFGLLVVWVWIATDALRPSLWWCGTFGLPLLFGLSLANAAPDIEGDRATGIGTLATRLGRPRAEIATWLSAALALALAAVGLVVFEVDRVVLVPVLVGGAALAAAGATASLIFARHWLAFRLYAATAAVTAAGWMLAA